MTYQKSIDYLYSLQKYGIKLGLHNIRHLLACLGSPQDKLPRVIHIAGTNGKGSTAAFLSSILSRAGYRTGLFTSPHLVSFTERIQVNNRPVSKKAVSRITDLVKSAMEPLGTMTFFEVVTAMALCYFSERRVDIAILEVGMGGRLDATNVVTPIISIITNITREHEYYLGSTLAEIAREKAGIIKTGGLLLTAATQPAVLSLFRKRCRRLKSTFYRLGKDFSIVPGGDTTVSYRGMDSRLDHLHIGLRGTFQHSNAALALAAVEMLRTRSCRIPDKAIAQGLRMVKWAGRCELVSNTPLVVLDGAHNPAAMKRLKETLLGDFDFKRLVLILGIMEDKHIKEMMHHIVPPAEQIILCRPQMERAAPTAILADFLRGLTVNFLQIDDVQQATRYALERACPGDLICITGSLFTVGEARVLFTKNSHSI